MVTITYPRETSLLPVILLSEFESPLGKLETPESILEFMKPGAVSPMSTDDDVKKKVRDTLRQFGFKPTGRSKPASEYLIKACEQEKLSSINPAVDILNAVSLHSGLPISVVDYDLISPPLKIGIPEVKSSYVFNLSGQEIDIGNLFCLFDSEGPCANAVKDSQRTKTSDSTHRALSIIWGSTELAERTESCAEWYENLLRDSGANVSRVEVQKASE